MPETALVKRIRAALDAHDRPSVELSRRDVEEILRRLLHGCGERNIPVRHPR